MSTWINVDKERPCDEQKVLAGWFGTSTVESMESVTFYADQDGDHGDRWRDCWNEEVDPPTHWMPLPASPLTAGRDGE